MTRKGEIEIVAALLTLSAVGNAPPHPAIAINADGTLTVPDSVKAEDLLDWDVFQIFNKGMNSKESLPANDPNWPSPVEGGTPAGGPPNVASLLALLKTLVPGSPQATAILGQLGPIIAALTAGATPAKPIPAPGVTATATT
jgi:hypothetical protein